jgi:PAS domain S-box-containing protein
VVETVGQGPGEADGVRGNADRLDLIRYAAAEPFVVVDEQGRLTGWNAAAERVFGRTAAEATGQSIVDVLVPARHRAQFRRQFQALLAGDAAVTPRLEFVARGAAGAEFAAELSVWAVPGAGEYHIPVRDIAACRRAAEAREQLVTSQRLLLDSSTEGIFGVDIDGRCTFVNPAAAAMLGWRVEELLGQDMHDAVHHSHPDGRRYPAGDCHAMRTLRAGREIRLADDVFWRRDGTAVAVEFSCALIRDGGTVQGAVFTFTDMNERRAAERKLRTAYEHERAALAKLTELDEAKSNFHDGDVGEITDDQRRALATMGRNADRLRGLIEDLLTVAHMETHPFRLHLAPTHLPTLVADVCEVAASAARERGHRLEIDVDARVATLPADATQLRRVLASLLDNAVKCTPNGGRVRVGLRAAAGAAELSVADNGIGIAPSELPRLFTRFFRTRAATQLAIQGAGLSLAIARQIVDGHGGSITVQSEPGVGSTFVVRLPVPPALEQVA